MNGGYWQNTMLPDGQQAMVKVQPPQRVIEADAENEAETAQLVYRNLHSALSLNYALQQSPMRR